MDQHGNLYIFGRYSDTLFIDTTQISTTANSMRFISRFNKNLTLKWVSSYIPNYPYSLITNNIGVDNGDPLDLASTKINERMVFNGKCLMILQSQLDKGVITVEAISEGLESCRIELSAL